MKTSSISAMVGLLLAATGCVNRPSDPFRSPATGPGGSRAEVHVVRFEVSCDTCTIRWSASPYGGSLEATALWSVTVRPHVYPEETVVARLSAAPEPGAGEVKYVRILVDGDLVAQAPAEDSGMPDRHPFRPLSVETPVPPRRGDPLPVRGGGP